MLYYSKYRRQALSRGERRAYVVMMLGYAFCFVVMLFSLTAEARPVEARMEAYRPHGIVVRTKMMRCMEDCIRSVHSTRAKLLPGRKVRYYCDGRRI